MSEAYEKILKSSFEGRYSKNADIWSGEKAMAECSHFFREHTLFTQSHLALDLGAGRGRDVNWLLELGYHVTALDLVLTPELQKLKQTKENHLTLQEENFLTNRFLEKNENSFQVIIDNGCFHHQAPASYEAYLKLVRRYLKGDGHYCLSVFSPNDPNERSGSTSVIDGGRLGKYFSLGELSAVLEACGLFVVKSKRIYRADCDRYYLAAMAKAGHNL